MLSCVFYVTKMILLENTAMKPSCLKLNDFDQKILNVKSCRSQVLITCTSFKLYDYNIWQILKSTKNLFAYVTIMVLFDQVFKINL